MKKWILVLSALIAVVGLGFLPAIAEEIQDRQTRQTVFYRPLQSAVSLDIEKDSGLSVADKLGILRESEISTLVPELASTPQEQIRNAVETGLAPYVEAGILVPFEDCIFQAQPYIAISFQEPRHWFVFWEVCLVTVNTDVSRSLYIRLDDETGTFLSMQYTDPAPQEPLPEQDEKWPDLERFAEIWLKQADLWESTPWEQRHWRTGEDRRVCVYELPELSICFSLLAPGEYSLWTENYAAMMQPPA